MKKSHHQPCLITTMLALFSLGVGLTACGEAATGDDPSTADTDSGTAPPTDPTTNPTSDPPTEDECAAVTDQEEGEACGPKTACPCEGQVCSSSFAPFEGAESIFSEFYCSLPCQEGDDPCGYVSALHLCMAFDQAQTIAACVLTSVASTSLFKVKVWENADPAKMTADQFSKDLGLTAVVGGKKLLFDIGLGYTTKSEMTDGTQIDVVKVQLQAREGISSNGWILVLTVPLEDWRKGGVIDPSKFSALLLRLTSGTTASQTLKGLAPALEDGGDSLNITTGSLCDTANPSSCLASEGALTLKFVIIPAKYAD